MAWYWSLLAFLFFLFVCFTWWKQRDYLKAVFYASFDQHGDRSKLPWKAPPKVVYRSKKRP